MTNLIEAAKERKIEPELLQALEEVESAGSGFLPTGEPRILFEAHIFSRLTKGKWDKDRPSISSPRWNKELYSTARGEHRRLAQATALDRAAALQSASWGAFQVLGTNYEKLGYDSVQAFVNDAYSEEGQLRMFLRFIDSTKGLVEALQKKEFKKIAELYNGPKYAENKYDTKIETAYKKRKGS
jgi:hypothetical protein